jgi:predicted ATP-binding protein involved in virulence/cyclopropane fatty-acyl-phospholipid synthase-like methyltransferase
MKYNKIYISDKITSKFGIKEINISKLSNIVALVGRNGSGKTRIIEIFKKILLKKISYDDLFNNSITGLSPEILKEVKKLKPFREHLIRFDIDLQNSIDGEGLKPPFDPIKHANIFLILKSLKEKLNNLQKSFLRTIEYQSVVKLQETFNTNDKKGFLSFEELISNINNNSNITNEIESINLSALEFVNSLPHKLVHEKIEALYSGSIFEESKIFKIYESFKKTIFDFLKKELTWEKKATDSTYSREGVLAKYQGTWKLDGREFNYLDLSSGEKILFAYSMLFFLLKQNESSSIKDCIFLIDEIELHLHPESEIALIDGLRNSIGDQGQLIFSTHSINILSHLKYDEVFTVIDGQISNPTYDNINSSISQLMGIEESIEKLTNFLSDQMNFAFLNFVKECLFQPETIEYSSKNDPQLNALKEALAKLSTSKENILLDCGAGKGRLLDHLISENFPIQLHALEPNIDFMKRIKDIGINNVYQSYEQLQENAFKFILLCNVLHEIKISEWPDTFKRIKRSLTDDGYLIIIEAKTLSKGETIGSEGYILLNEEEIENFLTINKSSVRIFDNNTDSKIVFVAIEMQNINNLENNSIREMLTTLKKRMYQNIKNIKVDQNIDLRKRNKFGRLLGHYTQQYLNCKIALDLLKE